MPLHHTKTSGAARTAVIYITLGAIADVWTVLWYLYMQRHGTAGDGQYFFCYGFFFTGLALIIIGLAIGQIGRAARHAEAPTDITNNPTAAAPQQTVPQQTAAAPVAAIPLQGVPAAATPTAAAPAASPAGTLQPR